MINGALVATANSSGGCLLTPIWSRSESQPAKDKLAPSKNAARTTRPETIFMICSRLAGLAARTHVRLQQRVITNRDRPEGDRRIGHIEDIPIKAADIKVKKVGNLVVDEPVDEIA